MNKEKEQLIFECLKWLITNKSGNSLEEIQQKHKLINNLDKELNEI